MANTPKPSTVANPTLDDYITPEWGDAVNAATGALLDFCHGVVANAAARTALTPTAGFTVYQVDVKKIYSYDGANWIESPGGVKVVTSGSRPTSPTEGMWIDETDTDRLLRYDGTNWTLPKSSAGPYVCTSGTRPSAGLFEGLLIHETDTDRYLRYSGSQWERISGSEAATAGTTGLTTSMAAAATLSNVPIGRWTFIGKGWFNWASATPGEQYDAELWDGTTQRDRAVHSSTVGTGQTPFSLLWTVTLAAVTTVSLRAKVSGIDGTQNVENIKLSAIPG